MENVAITVEIERWWYYGPNGAQLWSYRAVACDEWGMLIAEGATRDDVDTARSDAAELRRELVLELTETR